MNLTYLKIVPKWRSSGMKLFDKIRILRKARGLSQEQLGYSLSRVNKDGISRQTVSDWENGKFEPKLENIRDLAEVFNVSFDALLDESVDLENEKVLEAVLNKKPYEKEKDTTDDEVIIETPKANKNRITFKELAVLVISSYFTIAGISAIFGYIFTLIENNEPFFVSTILIELVIDFVFFCIFAVALAFTIVAIFRKKSLKLPLILLLIGTGLAFAFATYAGVCSLIMHLDGHAKGASSYTVNGYPSTYEKMIAGTIARVSFSLLRSAGMLAASILLFVSYRKQQKIEVMKTTAAEVY